MSLRRHQYGQSSPTSYAIVACLTYHSLLAASRLATAGAPCLRAVLLSLRTMKHPGRCLAVSFPRTVGCSCPSQACDRLRSPPWRRLWWEVVQEAVSRLAVQLVRQAFCLRVQANTDIRLPCDHSVEVPGMHHSSWWWVMVRGAKQMTINSPGISHSIHAQLHLFGARYHMHVLFCLTRDKTPHENMLSSLQY